MATLHTDIRADSLIIRSLPPRARPYARLMRLDRPVGWWLLLLPCWWATALAAPFDRDWPLYPLFWVGAVVMRGAGCTLNDILDRDIDARVERTRTRPIPAGEITVREAVWFLGAELAVGAVVLFCLNRLAIALGLLVLIPIAIYPLMKRITFWPQFFLGLNFNWGALVGWSAATGRLDLPAFLLYLAGIAWTLGYDTIYAHQDKRDDPKAGVKSTALRLGDRSRLYVGMFYTGCVTLLAAALIAGGAGPWAWLPWLLAGLHFGWQLIAWDPDDPTDCLRRFQSNRTAGLIIATACLAARF